VRALARLGGRQPAELGGVGAELDRVEPRDVAVLLRHVTHPLPQLEGARGRVEPQHLDPAARGREQPEEDLEQRGLARAVGAEEPDAGRGQAELHVAQRLELAVVSTYALQVQQHRSPEDGPF